ncbi:hypothetical protein GBA65_05930 [Rubrobacter marinus]|uniref:Uncharacterized protein n=1 Tax=Rubrobacter marinus TaxID=2653852 RepID=A0A6G8Q2L5_9ACTN|nr:hypothetical protein GBA65_05930 [Rubrobacter marinus]
MNCTVRGIDPPCAYCAYGRYALCIKVTEGDIAPGIQTGFCGSTGGAGRPGRSSPIPRSSTRSPTASPTRPPSR